VQQDPPVEAFPEQLAHRLEPAPVVAAGRLAGLDLDADGATVPTLEHEVDFALARAEVHHLSGRRRQGALLEQLRGHEVLQHGSEGVRVWQLSYYDAQIWAAAALGVVPVVLSEDFADGTVLGGVVFADPFAPDFELDRLR
jgi:hypothetical protein